jgi:uncharacterized protein
LSPVADHQAADRPSGDRIAALDLVRGVAVLGILAVNIAGFSGPMIAATTPHWAGPASPLDEAAFALTFVLFEGKMRALFTILFGASMLLFLERAETAGLDAPALQFRRLGWLALFGYLHFALLWWGDILFPYALCGMVALLFWKVPTRTMLALALAIFALSHAFSMVGSLPGIVAEEQFRLGTATAEQAEHHRETMLAKEDRAEQELALYRSSWPAQVTHALTEARFWPVAMTVTLFGESLPFMLIGMALYRSGFFSGVWRRESLRVAALACVGIGGAMTIGALAYAWPRHFPPVLMNALLARWLALPHLLMALGYAALLILAAPRLMAGWLGLALSAAGRAAFSNYIATSLVMTAIFYGWGLGLVGKVGAAAQWLYVVLGWMLMLAWNKPWLERFRQGPLEWLWRSLAAGRVVEFKR